jgi:hypothetical protein
MIPPIAIKATSQFRNAIKRKAATASAVVENERLIAIFFLDCRKSSGLDYEARLARQRRIGANRRVVSRRQAHGLKKKYLEE